MSEELLGFARGKVNIRPRLTSVRRLMELLDEEILNQVRDTHVRLVIRITEADHLTLDEARLTRCLANIIKNAKEALGDEGTITIQFRESGSELQVSISDSGPGIPESIRSRIFEPFVTYGKKHGTGLGMAIAKSTVDAHGGRIWLESETGKGTTFHVVLPKHFDSGFAQWLGALTGLPLAERLSAGDGRDDADFVARLAPGFRIHSRKRTSSSFKKTFTKRRI